MHQLLIDSYQQCCRDSGVCQFGNSCKLITEAGTESRHDNGVPPTEETLQGCPRCSVVTSLPSVTGSSQSATVPPHQVVHHIHPDAWLRASDVVLLLVTVLLQQSQAAQAFQMNPAEDIAESRPAAAVGEMGFWGATMDMNSGSQI